MANRSPYKNYRIWSTSKLYACAQCRSTNNSFCTLRTTWKKCCFSGDGEYICAGSARQHALYIWEKSIGNLVKILHGTKGELLLDVVWHPVRPIIASISSGLVSIWAQNQVENWSAFAPDFKELDENVEYEERESEFDIADEDKSVDLNADAQQDEEIEVDVQKVEPVAAFCSSDEEGEDENALQFLPMAPEVEDPEDGWTSQDNLEPSSALVGNDSRDYEEDIMATKRRRMQHYDVSLPDAPTDGKRNELQSRLENIHQPHLFFLQKLTRLYRARPARINSNRLVAKKLQAARKNNRPQHL